MPRPASHGGMAAERRPAARRPRCRRRPRPGSAAPRARAARLLHQRRPRLPAGRPARRSRPWPAPAARPVPSRWRRRHAPAPARRSCRRRPSRRGGRCCCASRTWSSLSSGEQSPSAESMPARRRQPLAPRPAVAREQLHRRPSARSAVTAAGGVAAHRFVQVEAGQPALLVRQMRPAGRWRQTAARARRRTRPSPAAVRAAHGHRAAHRARARRSRRTSATLRRGAPDGAGRLPRSRATRDAATARASAAASASASRGSAPGSATRVATSGHPVLGQRAGLVEDHGVDRRRSASSACRRRTSTPRRASAPAAASVAAGVASDSAQGQVTISTATATPSAWPGSLGHHQAGRGRGRQHAPSRNGRGDAIGDAAPAAACPARPAPSSATIWPHSGFGAPMRSTRTRTTPVEVVAAGDARCRPGAAAAACDSPVSSASSTAAVAVR